MMFTAFAFHRHRTCRDSSDWCQSTSRHSSRNQRLTNLSTLWSISERGSGSQVLRLLQSQSGTRRNGAPGYPGKGMLHVSSPVPYRWTLLMSCKSVDKTISAYWSDCAIPATVALCGLDWRKAHVPWCFQSWLPMAGTWCPTCRHIESWQIIGQTFRLRFRKIPGNIEERIISETTSYHFR